MNNGQEENSGIMDTVEVVGSELLERVRKIIRAGNARRLVIRKSNGEALLEIPLTVGIAGGAAMIYLAPVLTAVAAIGALFTRVRLDIIRKQDY